MYIGILVSVIAVFGERNPMGSTPNIFIDMASAYFTINCKSHQNAHGFMLIKLILEAHKAKIDWLRAQLAVNKILLKVISDCRTDGQPGCCKTQFCRVQASEFFTGYVQWCWIPYEFPDPLKIRPLHHLATFKPSLAFLLFLCSGHKVY